MREPTKTQGDYATSIQTGSQPRNRTYDFLAVRHQRKQVECVMQAQQQGHQQTAVSHNKLDTLGKQTAAHMTFEMLDTLNV